MKQVILILLAVIACVCATSCRSSDPLFGHEEEVIGPQQRSLRWLESEQNADGSWGKASDAQPALTSLAILAFLSYGETPASEEFGKCVENGMRRLFAWTETGLPADRIENEIISTDAIYTWVLCDTYSMTCIPVFLEPASNAVHSLMSSPNQSPWVVPALWSAQCIDHVTGLTRDACRSRISKVAGAVAGDDLLARARKAQAFFLTENVVKDRARRKAIVTDLATNVWKGWRTHGEDYPLLTWYLCNFVFFYEGGDIWYEWSRAYHTRAVREQWRSDEDGHWDYPVTPDGKGNKGKSLWQGHDSQIYATAVISMSFPPSRSLPMFQVPASRYDERKNPMDRGDIVIEIEP